MEGTQEKRTDWSGVIIGLAVLPVLLVFIHLGKADLGRSASIGLGMILLAIRLRWDLRRHVWFWATVLLVLGLDVPLFFLIRWPKGWTPAVIIWPFAVVDLMFILGAVRAVENLMARRKE